jgi:C4-dicarboxylate transporter DctM subunit
MIGLIFIIFFVFLFAGIPIVTSMGLTTLFPLFTSVKVPYNADTVIRWAVQGADSIPIIAIPMFILAGVVMAQGAISKKLFDMFAYFLGKRTAGLPIAAIITSLFYGAISGSGVATAAAVGGMTIPLLTKLGYDKKFSAAMVATAGGLGVIIPPSIPFVMYGMMTQTSVGDIFIAGIIPGLLIALSLMIYAFYYCKKNGEDREKIDETVDELKKKGLWVVFKESFWALMSPVIILGGIYSGIVTPTEAATISVAYSLIVSIFIYKTISVKEIGGLFTKAVGQYAALIMLIALATSFSRMITVLQGAKIVGDFVTNYISLPIMLLLSINLLMFLMGMVMDTGFAVVILGPVLAPVGAMMGISPIHLAVVMVSNLAIGMVTPPFGMNLFVVAPMVEESAFEIGKKAIPFIISFIVALILITYVPDISMFLVRAMKG